eukprot:scaffold166963_cov58-Attheya_sp.AAC.1
MALEAMRKVCSIYSTYFYVCNPVQTDRRLGPKKTKESVPLATSRRGDVSPASGLLLSNKPGWDGGGSP